MTKGDKVGYNEVHQAEIWREYIAREWWTTTEWPKKYGFLSEESKKLQTDILTLRQSSALGSNNESEKDTPQPKTAEQGLLSSSSKVPPSTSQMIGWMISKQENPEYINGYSSNVKYRSFLEPSKKYGRKKLEQTLGIPAEAMN